jgi:pyrroloquinoline-quinone synthase
MTANLIERLDAATADRRLLDHPFYKAWAAGTLSTEDLRFYSTQYWRQVEAFPGYLEQAAAKLEDDEARDVVLDNLRDEVDDDHAGLWLRFAAALGAPEEEVRFAPIEEETARCVGSFRGGTEAKSAAFALGMLYGYESQTPKVAETKVAGLRDRYGIIGPAVEYFTLHGKLDVEHSRELARAVAEVASDDADAVADAAAGARAGAEAIWTLLDGVARARGI